MRSPSRWKEPSDEDPIPFGKHKGKKLKDVPADYLLWFADHPTLPKGYPGLALYVRRVREVLEAEAKDAIESQALEKYHRDKFLEELRKKRHRGYYELEDFDHD